MRIYLEQPAIISALGSGAQETLNSLFSDKDTLSQEAGFMPDAEQEMTVGRVHETLADFPEDTPEYLKSRNNRLLETALQQIAPAIAQTITLYGKERVAVVLGTSTTGSDENEMAFRRYVEEGTPWEETGYSQNKQLLASPAVYLAWRFGIASPAYGISTACTSGAKTLISAARLLKSGMVDAVICGGVDSLSPFTLNGFNSLSVLSPTPCHPFGADRSGINIGEGAAIFIATREPTQDKVHLAGYGAGSDAYHMSTPRPDGVGALAVMSQALHKAKRTSQEIGWINAHGTGTQANDAMEALAIEKLFDASVPVTSTKSRTGHCLGSAGAIEAAIAWLITAKSTNPNAKLPAQGYLLDPSLSAIHLSTENNELKHRRVLSNSFAFGGNNTALLLEVEDDD
ncbi:beta-ketoacyl-ACP synthase [Suttonella ornithocola]|uniref:3-oxoacyl-[acyl-carrier-protein] synthase 2 n=1 Tax=Suttonella ornithocola TaxID=279832 RepID=A0A380MYB9_9GAMM|nr:beta-ketoacyl-ACP synthase [Suttonella ornithocola]SUO97214.1 3-oxoacyl-[acyl-carrier-protein] synthase 2 [Suttonella ornithocola]